MEIVDNKVLGKCLFFNEEELRFIFKSMEVSFDLMIKNNIGEDGRDMYCNLCSKIIKNKDITNHLSSDIKLLHNINEEWKEEGDVYGLEKYLKKER